MSSKLGAAGRTWVRAPGEGGPQGWQSLLCTCGDQPTEWGAQHLRGQVWKALGDSSAPARVGPAWLCLEAAVSCSVSPGLLVPVTDGGGTWGRCPDKASCCSEPGALCAAALRFGHAKSSWGCWRHPGRVSPQPGGAWRGPLRCTLGPLDLSEACVITAGLAGRPGDRFADGRAEAPGGTGGGVLLYSGHPARQRQGLLGLRLWLQLPCLGLSELPWSAQALGRQFHPREPPSCGSFSLSPRGGEGRPN